jgi:hypothetical protein
MMYQNKFVVAIKAGGKVLRESKDLVQLPFGSEFSVLVKNLNSRRAKFTLNIDGTDVLDGTEIIVDANSEVEMKRFIRNGNMDEGNAFKFIERTQAIEDGPRGIKVDDGVVRVQFWFEKEKPQVVETVHHHRDVWWNDYYRRYPYYTGYYGSSGGLHSSDISNVRLGSARAISKGIPQASNATATFDGGASFNTSSSVGIDCVPAAETLNDAGITVPGSKVEQKFQTVYGFDAEAQSHVIILRLAGKVGEAAVVAPVTVKAKQKCTTCGHVNKANAKFCSDCGTALELL